MRRLVTPNTRDSAIAEYRRVKDTKGHKQVESVSTAHPYQPRRILVKFLKCIYIPNEAAQRMMLVAPRCYHIRPSRSLPSLCHPLQFLGAQPVCAMLGVPRDFWKFCPSKTSSGRSIQSHLSGGASSPVVTQAKTTNDQGDKKSRPTFFPDKLPIFHLWLSILFSYE